MPFHVLLLFESPAANGTCKRSILAVNLHMPGQGHCVVERFIAGDAPENPFSDLRGRLRVEVAVSISLSEHCN